MAKLRAWLLTLVGVLWVVHMFGWVPPEVSPIAGWMGWLVAVAFLISGVSKLIWCYDKKKKR